MTDETIVAVYDTAAHADAAVRDLEAINVPPSAISRHAGSSTTGQPGGTEPVREKGFWASLFGGDPGHDEAVYDRSLASGSSVVMVKVPDQHVQRVTDVLERHNPVDMDERAATYGTAMGGSATTTTTTTTQGTGTTQGAGMTHGTGAAAVATGASAVGEERLALHEEQLNVGKRLVNRGTTRIRRFVVETPVEEAVTLHSEQVSIERRPVTAGTKVTDVDFGDKTIEVTESTEEAVVAKTAHLREEVVINKTAADRVETVRDTVRREDVEITKDDTATRTAGTTTTTGTTATTGTTSTGSTTPVTEPVNPRPRI